MLKNSKKNSTNNLRTVSRTPPLAKSKKYID